MTNIAIQQPKKLEIGIGCINQLITDLKQIQVGAVFILIDEHVASSVLPLFAPLSEIGIAVEHATCGSSEPSFGDFDDLVEKARKANAGFIVGIGGGSVLDVAKVIAALIGSNHQISEYVGNGLIGKRNTPLVCVPTTSGAGSESSPNAIFIDGADNAKKGIIDKVLVPDAVYIDPKLIASLPANVTAYTGLDALTHCIEAYANNFAHPVIDTYALEGIRLISQNLKKAVQDGNDLQARMAVGLGAYYGGMCLGPVNTAAVHALAYPLGTTYKLAHGLTNALLLPHVLEFNLEAAPKRYAAIANALGLAGKADTLTLAKEGIDAIRQLLADCGMQTGLKAYDVDQQSLPKMASEAIQIQRLLKNNVRDIGLNDAISIYERAY